MNIILKSVAFLGVLAMSAPAIAQDTTGAENTAEQTTDTSDVNLAPLELGQIYQRETHGDWVIECVSTATPANDPCEMVQILTDDGTNNVARISVSALTGKQADAPPAGVRITAPLMTLLPAGIGLSIDDGPTRTLPFFACNAAGCFTEFGLSETDVDALRKGAAGRVSLRPAAAPDQLVEAKLSLIGFTAALASLTGE